MKTILMLGAVLAATLSAANADWSVRYDERGYRGPDRDCEPRHERGYYEHSGYYERGGPPIRAGYVRVEECARPRPLCLEAQAQIRLRRLGYYYGPVDGDFGYGSQRALVRFQYDYRLPATGCLDWRTRRALGV